MTLNHLTRATQATRSGRMAAAFAALAGAILVCSAEANAGPRSCLPRYGTVRVWDADSNRCGFLTENNPNWKLLGAPPWDDRMDEFGNDDWIHGRSMCFYDRANYAGANFLLKVGYYQADRNWYNRVSANRWTTASNCPW